MSFRSSWEEGRWQLLRKGTDLCSKGSEKGVRCDQWFWRNFPISLWGFLRKLICYVSSSTVQKNPCRNHLSCGTLLAPCSGDKGHDTAELAGRRRTYLLCPTHYCSPHLGQLTAQTVSVVTVSTLKLSSTRNCRYRTIRMLMREKQGTPLVAGLIVFSYLSSDFIWS